MTLTLVYVVIKEGVYRHDIVGVWDSLDLAKAAAEGAIAAEKDDYHRFVVVETPLNLVGTDKVVCTLSREDEWKANKTVRTGRIRTGTSTKWK